MVVILFYWSEVISQVSSVRWYRNTWLGVWRIDSVTNAYSVVVCTLPKHLGASGSHARHSLSLTCPNAICNRVAITDIVGSWTDCSGSARCVRRDFFPCMCCDEGYGSWPLDEHDWWSVRPHQYRISHLEIKELDRNRENDDSMSHSDHIRLKQTKGEWHRWQRRYRTDR